MKIQLSIFTKILVISSCIILLVTGVGWWVDQQIMMNDPAVLAIYLLKIHGIVAMLSVGWLGGLLYTHINAAWRRKKNRVTGAILLLIMGYLVLSGLGLYYANQQLRDYIQLSHFYVGVLVLAALPLHILVAKWRKNNHATAKVKLRNTQ